MARDPRKNSAFESGLRGREKPKVADSHGSTAVNDNAGGESRQAAGKTIGDPGGVDHMDPAYSSGMRGMEKAKQKPASGAGNEQPSGGVQAGNHQKPHSTVGDPAGHNDAGRGERKGFGDGAARGSGEDAYAMGNDGNAANSSERAAEGKEPQGDGILGEEDDTHINIRIPKASLKKKAGGLQTS
jgi:hypothetical protein